MTMDLVSALPILTPFVEAHPTYLALRAAWVRGDVDFNRGVSPYYLLRQYIRKGEVGSQYVYCVNNEIQDISKLHAMFYEIVQDLKNSQELKSLLLKHKLGVNT